MMDVGGRAIREEHDRGRMRAAMVLAARRAEFEEVLTLRASWWASLEAEGVDHVEGSPVIGQDGDRGHVRSPADLKGRKEGHDEPGYGARRNARP